MKRRIYFAIELSLGKSLRFVRPRAHARAKRKSCAVEMRNAILRNYLNSGADPGFQKGGWMADHIYWGVVEKMRTFARKVAADDETWRNNNQTWARANFSFFLYYISNFFLLKNGGWISTPLYPPLLNWASSKPTYIPLSNEHFRPFHMEVPAAILHFSDSKKWVPGVPGDFFP